MAEEPTPGVVAPPAEPAAPAAPAPAEPAPGTEPVQKPASEPEQTVPFSRFQEVNDKAKAKDDEIADLREQLSNRVTPQSDDDLDPEVVDLVSKSAKRLGYVTQDELKAQETAIQVRQDVRDLESTPPVPGIAYDHKAVVEYAKANNLPVTSKGALQAAYKELNWDAIIQAERQKAIDDFTTAGASGAEKPGPTGAQPPAEPDVSGKNPRERTMSRIARARQNLTT